MAAEEEVEEEVLVLSLPSEVEVTISLDDDGESLRFSSLSASARELMHILKIAHCCAGVVFGRKREGEDSVVGRDGLFCVVFPRYSIRINTAFLSTNNFNKIVITTCDDLLQSNSMFQRRQTF